MNIKLTKITVEKNVNNAILKVYAGLDDQHYYKKTIRLDKLQNYDFRDYDALQRYFTNKDNAQYIKVYKYYGENIYLHCTIPSEFCDIETVFALECMKFITIRDIIERDDRIKELEDKIKALDVTSDFVTLYRS